MNDVLVGVDVGTGSARAGVLTARGDFLGRAEHPIAIRREGTDRAEHDSGDIWRAVCAAVRAALAEAGADPGTVAGIGFDATCSLVVRAADGAPLAVGTSGEARWDTIVWLDHRAIAEAEECATTGHRLLGHNGGAISPEMQSPKLMWLKRHLPHTWARAGLMFDLADFLTWKATASRARSRCTLSCKWPYLGHESPGWQLDFLRAVGLEDLLERGGLPEAGSPIGADLGPLTAQAAAALGLTPRCRVGAGLIDAYAGMLGVLGGSIAGGEAGRHLGLIAGTSSCIMAMSPEPLRAPGIWGPYHGAALPGLWVSEGGQSATGALLDHVICWHGAGGTPDTATHARIIARVQDLRRAEGADFAARLHVLPDFHGNRSPLADPHAVGVISGLTLDAGFDSLCRLYWRTAVAIALGVRHILDALNAHGYAIDTLHVTGGHLKNPLLMELYCDATGCAVVEPATPDAVLLGAAMAAATACGLHPGLAAAARAMSHPGRTRAPDPVAAARLARDYRIFRLMHAQRAAIDAQR